ncbi:lysylphosphatidylglycerol synthase transmembrane domain-containing protein [Piscinibacter terrae]|uniref:lysylphosphatidylglycerol synthase transmembrane domain-containing protein n=1 Tax=Piscinibacter terrae TaxID=2496871 RepID=UPI0013873917|nr:YbhN family protein [Albitalea terrae]
MAAPASNDALRRATEGAARVAWNRFGSWPRRVAILALLLAGIGLWVTHLESVDWRGMGTALAAMPLDRLWWATGLTATSYLAYSSIDLLARRVTGHAVRASSTLLIGFVSHACALNLGPAGAGFRFRLYMSHGVDAVRATAIWLFNIATNWIGFAAVAGTALAGGWIHLPDDWGLITHASRLAGLALLGSLIAYFVLCMKAHGHAWSLFGHRIMLPTPSVAAMQCALSSANWLLLAGVIAALLPSGVPFSAVLGALLASAIALAVIDVPAGLGVTETVFLAMLGSLVPVHELLAALLAYRALYFGGPLLLALALYAGIESRRLVNRRAAVHGE